MSQASLLGLSVIALVLAYFSWRYVETPFRNRQRFNRQKIYSYGAAGSMLFLAFGFAGHATRGFDIRLPEEQRNLLAYNSYAYKAIYREGQCFLEADQSFKVYAKECATSAHEGAAMIWGDSHAAALSFGLRNTFQHVTQYTASGCPPLLGVDFAWRPKCRAVNDFVASQIKKLKPSQIFLHANWTLYKEHNPVSNLQATIDFIRRESPASKIVIVGGVPQYRPSLPSYMFANQKKLEMNIFMSSYMHDDLLLLDDAFNGLAKANDVGFYSAVKALCKDEVCQATAEFDGEIMPTAWDYGHLTSAGSVLLAQKMKAI